MPNLRQRVFDVMTPGVPMSPQQVNAQTGLGVESVRAVLKWLAATGRCIKRRRGRQFDYELIPGTERPIDGRSHNLKR